MSFLSRSPDSQPSDKWEILHEQIEFEEELGRGAFGVVYKATFSKSDEMEALVTETSKWPVLSRKPKAPQLVAVKVLQGKKKKLMYIKERKPQALEIVTYVQFFLCSRKEFFPFSFPVWIFLRPQQQSSREKIQIFGFFCLALLVSIGVVNFSFYHCYPSKTTVKA